MDEKTADSETKAYILLRELVLYSIFLTLLVVCKYTALNHFTNMEGTRTKSLYHTFPYAL